MNPALKFLCAAWGLTEEQLDDIANSKPVKLNVGEVFCNGDEHVTEVRAEHLVRALKRVTPRNVLELFVWAATIVEAKTAAEAKELERAVANAAGEGMGTARSNSQAPSAPPNTRPWTPEDKIPN